MPKREKEESDLSFFQNKRPKIAADEKQEESSHDPMLEEFLDEWYDSSLPSKKLGCHLNMITGPLGGTFCVSSIIKFLIAKKADLNIGNYKDGSSGYTALHWCAGKGDLEFVKLLIEAGAAINLVNNCPPLNYSFSIYNQPKIAIQNLGDNKQTPLFCAIMRAGKEEKKLTEEEKLPVVQYLLENGAKLHPDTRLTVLQYLHETNSIKIKTLLENKGQLALNPNEEIDNYDEGFYLPEAMEDAEMESDSEDEDMGIENLFKP